jgi:methionyl-tRNA formyltransferase
MKIPKAKIVFFGSSHFSEKILAALSIKYEIVLVITQSDKPVGRKKIMQQTPVALLAKKLNLPLIKPENLKSEETAALIENSKADLFVVVAYGKIIPQQILDFPQMGAINIHASLLPKYRGASPIHSALLNGDKETGITIMLMDAQMDHGPVLSKGALAIDDKDTFPELEKKLAILAEKLILTALPKFISGKLKAKTQEHQQATYTKIINRQDGEINWNRPAFEIYNKYRAYIIWPGIWTKWNNKILKITACKIYKGHFPEKYIGKVFQENKKVFVSCQVGFIEILQLQLEGKTAMPIANFLKGHKNFVGSLLG